MYVILLTIFNTTVKIVFSKSDKTSKFEIKKKVIKK